MATGPKWDVGFRRKREGKTDYNKRLALLKSGKPRLVIRLSNKLVRCQVIDRAAGGDAVKASATSQDLAKLGWKGAGANTPAAYLVGYLCGKRAKKAKVGNAVLDMGFQAIVKGSNVFACLKGAVDAGLEVPHDASVFPQPERLEGAHIKSAAKPNVAEVKKAIDSKT